MQKDDWDCLPESMQQIAEVIGLDGAERLVRAVGGARFKFGKGRHNTARMKLLRQAVGKAGADKLAAVFGGMSCIFRAARCSCARCAIGGFGRRLWL